MSAPGNDAGESSHWLPPTILGVFIVAYAALSHYSSTHPDAKNLGAELSIGPVMLIGLVMLWRWVSALAALLAAAATACLLWRYWPVIERNYEWADLAQQCAVYALIAAGFARSLGRGREPLCEQLATKIHGALAPIEIAYMRRATLAWSLFYAVLAAAIFVLYFKAPLSQWSLFVNFGTFSMIVLAGLADHALRRRLLPRHPPGGLLRIIRQSLIG